MRFTKFARCGALLALAAALAGCGGVNFGRPSTNVSDQTLRQRANLPVERTRQAREGRSSLFDLFRNVDDPNRLIGVNRYIWVAAQDILDFMPIETADPFSGVIVYGYGRPPGGGQAYRATVYVQDPALDARSLNVALATSAGPASADTTRAIEDAILTRARQLRIRDAGL